jgi:leucine dehydrogenase
MCLPETVGGSGNPSRFTALVGWLAARAGWEFLTGSDSLDGLTIAIQGAGQVGQHFIDILTEGKPGKILIADRERVQIENVKKLLHRKALSHLLEEKAWKDPFDSSKDKLEVSQSSAEHDDVEISNYILYSQCDVLITVAVGKVVYPANVPFLRCKLIVPIANNTYSDNDLVARKIWERGIVDVVENNVNWGGAAVAASELYGYDEDHVIRWCVEKAYPETKRLLEEARDQGVPAWEILKLRAESQMKQAHPIVEIARRYHFIGRINESFGEWIKSKWLPNISGIDTDRYAKYVVERADAKER